MGVAVYLENDQVRWEREVNDGPRGPYRVLKPIRASQSGYEWLKRFFVPRGITVEPCPVGGERVAHASLRVTTERIREYRSNLLRCGQLDDRAAGVAVELRDEADDIAPVVQDG